MGGFDSALIWAQRSDQSLFGTYSWVNAREAYYQALTTGSESKFATTFLTLGQVMHLVSDMALPAHVRNDPHLVSDPYEDWTTLHSEDLPYASNYPISTAIFNYPATSTIAPLPISALWDKDIYYGFNPDPLWSMDAGLAEFTNANFLSQDSFGQYTHPTFTDHGLLYEVKWHDRPTAISEDNKPDKPAYIWRLVGGQPKYRLAAANYFAIDTDDGIVTGSNKTLDREVHKDYAKILIPRAMGYSTALLDYFFRGKIEITPPDRFVFGIIDDADFYNPATGARNGEQVFTELQAKVRNISDDAIGSGTIQLVARYLRRNDYTPDLTNDPPQPASVQDENGQFYPYSTSVSLPIWIPSMSKTTATPYTFNFTASPIPAGITDLDLFVVFKGTLGKEVDKAVAVGRVAEMNEPFHYAVENSTEYEISRTGSLYKHSGWSKGFTVCFNPYPGTCDFPDATTLAPGKYGKIIILYAGKELGIHYQDTLWTTTPIGGWINNLSRSKFLTSGNIAETYGFRGVYNHASFLSYNSLYEINPYLIPAFNDPDYVGFLPFLGMPVHVNIAP